MTTTGDAALRYARLGLRVLPLHNPDEDGRCSCKEGARCATAGKHPRIMRWQEKATSDEPTVRRWWDMWPEANVGIATGGGLAVLDVDSYNGGDAALESLQAAHGRELPDTAKVATGGGGWHHYMRAPAGTRSRRLGSGLELKGEGTYVVSPPSIHESSREYVWVNDGKRADAPVWLLEQGHERRNGCATPVEDAILEGQRNNALTSLAGTMRRRSMGTAEIEAALQVTNERRCRPPLAADEVRKVAQSVGRYMPEESAATVAGASGLATLRADEGDLAELGRQAWSALGAANELDPHLFRFGDRPCRIEFDDADTPVARHLGNDTMRYELSHAARWVKTGKAGEVPARVPMDGVRQVLATPDPPLPVLSRIVDVPVLAADGSVVTAAGYNRGLYLAREMPGLDVPDDPTEEDIAAARDPLLELVGDFPFTSDSARATALGLLLLPSVRELIDGPTPLHLFEKPTPGTGATLLVDVLLNVFAGRPLNVMTASSDDDEMRKRITTRLLQSPPYILFDNLTGILGGDALPAAITASTWEDRRLGFNLEAKAPVRCPWAATGNNPSLSEEVARRTVRCRLDAGVPDPHLRDPMEYAHPDLRGWARENRGRLVGAALTLARAWVVRGCPYRGRRLGMFEEWSEVVGGVLEVAEVPGFLEELVLPVASHGLLFSGVIGIVLPPSMASASPRGLELPPPGHQAWLVGSIPSTLARGSSHLSAVSG